MANLKDLIVNGASRFIGKVFINDSHIDTINGVEVGNNPVFTDTVTTVTTSGSGNAITAISASNGAITATKGTTFLTSHQDISGKADKSATVSTVTWDSTNKKLTKTINGTTTDVVTAATLRTGLNVANGAEVNQNAFSNIKVGSTTIAADAKTDTFELVAGSNITLTPDATNDKVTIAATDTTYSVATTSSNGLMSAADKLKLDSYNATYQVPDESISFYLGNAQSIISVSATPQQYGAKGDGITDDSDAINTCLHDNQFVYIPEGVYRVTKTINLHIVKRNTVICSDKAMIIADATAFNDAIQAAEDISERPSVLKFSSYVGWNQFGPTWFGGVISCNNVDGLIGVSINRYSGAFAYVPKMFITDIGDDGIGIYINNSSSKIRFDQLFITGAIVTIGENGNWTITRNLEKTTIGLYNDNSYDYSIGTLDINSCTIGVYSTDGDDIFCEHYHYWAGLDSDSMSYDQYLKTRAFFSSNGRWIFGYFYNDQAYVGAECSYIICENIKQNTAAVDSITNIPSGTSVVAYLLYPKSSWGFYGLYNIRTYSNTIHFEGILHTNVTFYSLWRMNALKFSIAEQAVTAFGNTYFGIYNKNFMRFGSSITANTKYVIGYVQKPMPGQIHLKFNHTQLVGECDINIYNNNIYITNAKKAFSNGTWTIAIGSSTLTIQNEVFYPIVLSHSADRGWTAWVIQADGTAPIMAPLNVTTVYSGSVTGSTNFA